MTLTVDMNTRGFSRIAGMWVAATNKSVREWLTHAGRVLVSYLMAITPPFPKNPIKTWRNGGTLDHKRVGEMAVRRDVLKIFRSFRSLSAIHAQTFGGHANRWLQRYAKANDLPKIYKMLDDFKVKAEVDIKPTAEKHKAHLRHRYDRFNVRVVGKPVYITDEKSIDQYVKDPQSRVGTAKAGWGPSAARIGLQARYFPSWVRSKLGQGSYIDQRHNPQAPSYTMINNSDNADAARPLIPAAMRLLRITEEKSLRIMLNKGYGRLPKVVR